VQDAVFLHRYSEPVLLVLHETKPSWAGMLRESKDSLEATAFSLNVAQKRHTRLWSIPDLPTDAFRVVAVPAGGALVLCQSLVLHVSQVCRWSALAVDDVLPSTSLHLTG
jgi:cleavage and polyadenylation specificity factor subunit 1